MMMNCRICGNRSGPLEICAECAPMVWPHAVINAGAKRLARALMPVPDPPRLKLEAVTANLVE